MVALRSNVRMPKNGVAPDPPLLSFVPSLCVSHLIRFRGITLFVRLVQIRASSATAPLISRFGPKNSATVSHFTTTNLRRAYLFLADYVPKQTRVDADIPFIVD